MVDNLKLTIYNNNKIRKMIKKRRTYYETTDDENSGFYIDRVNGSFNLYFGTNVNRTAIYTSTNLIYQSGNLFSIMVIGMKRGTISYLVYLLIGAVGLPVFSGFSGGLAKLAGPTGGYLVGFIFLALISGFLQKNFLITS